MAHSLDFSVARQAAGVGDDFVEPGIPLQKQFLGGVLSHAAGTGDDKQNAVALGAIFGGRQNLQDFGKHIIKKQPPRQRCGAIEPDKIVKVAVFNIASFCLFLKNVSIVCAKFVK